MSGWRIARGMCGFTIALCVVTRAQMNVAEIAGEVQDMAGGQIVHAAVRAVNTETNVKFASTTDDSGHFQVAELPPGDYSLTASADGFQQAIREHIVVHAGDRIRANFVLNVGQHTDVVVVESALGELQTGSAAVKDVIENQQVVDLPVRDREFLELAMLGPGVVNPPGGTRGDSLQQTGKLINILGQRTGHNLFLVDGVSATDEYFNNVALNPSPDDTREFNIAKTDYDAEFGGKSGGVINVITQSGTDLFHGSVYEFLRNNDLDARNFFDGGGPAPPFHENQFGAAFGGPVVKDRTFFFLNYDGQRIRESLADIFSVPTAAQRGGIFTTNILNPATGQPFPGNTIDVPLDPAAVALLARVPLPNLPGTANNLRAVDEQIVNTDQANARIDHRFSDRDSAWARGSFFDASEFDPFGSSVLNEALLPGSGRNLNTHSANAAAGETHSFSPSIVNEFRLGWMRVSGGQTDPNAGNPFASVYGIEGTTTNPKDMGFPQVSLSNQFTTMGDATGFTSRIDRDFELYDNVSVQRGRHSLKFGGYLFHLNFNPSYPNDARGVYTYSGAYTGNALADFLLGYPSQAQVGIGEGAENAHTNWAHFYAEDGWQVTHRFKFNFGLRYEYNQNLVARPNQTSDIDLDAAGGPAFVVAGNPATLPPAGAAIAALSPVPLVSAASVGWNSSLLKPKSLRLSPRVGLAWIIPNSGQTVFRAGFGIYTNQAAYSILQNLAENVPFFAVKTVANTSSKPLYNTEDILSFNPNGAIGANGVNNGFEIEYNEVWNAAIQRPIGAGTTIEANYVGSRTVHADSSTTVNVPETFGGPRPYPQLNAFTTIRWDGWATFNGLTLRLTRRFQHGLSFDASYSLSKSLDDASDTGTTNAEYNLPQDPYNPRSLEKGLSSFDHRNRVVANAVYGLPFGPTATGLRHWLIAGWRTSGILTVQSGAPFTVNLSSAAGQDVAHIGLVNGNNLERPDVIGNPNDGPKSAQDWFHTAAFVLPAQDTFGDAGRNIVTGPGLVDLDFSVQKEEPLRDRARIQLRFDLYNSVNHPNFNLPGRIFGASNFGVITSAGDAREMQAALKVIF
ncbi:MAG TPA: TonB-dependent receptor [Bryobacteraceae bacterium]